MQQQKYRFISAFNQDGTLANLEAPDYLKEEHYFRFLKQLRSAILVNTFAETYEQINGIVRYQQMLFEREEEEQYHKYRVELRKIFTRDGLFIVDKDELIEKLHSNYEILSDFATRITHASWVRSIYDHLIVFLDSVKEFNNLHQVNARIETLLATEPQLYLVL